MGIPTTLLTLPTWAELGSSKQPQTLPSPRPQLPSFLSARHLVLVPSKRMRRRNLPLPVIKACPAQLTPNRPPAGHDRHGGGLPGPLPPCHWRPGRNPGLAGSENPGCAFLLILHPFPAPWRAAGARGNGLQSSSLQLATEEAGWGGRSEVRPLEVPKSAEPGIQGPEGTAAESRAR